ncbi:class A beta-lactamase [Kistimonas scapharcae]|uniref:beta-lactamase n=1 Tax=Kistimonas scapharcae TaxID=1036133 RepID=A0ABP8V240_9GAMM
MSGTTVWAASSDSVEQVINRVEKTLHAHVGVSVYDTATQKHWSYNGDERVPLMSTFKTLACAKLLNDVAKGRVTLHHPVTVEKASLVSWSPVLEKYSGQTITLEQACVATLQMSDNSAANIILKQIGGPEALTQYLRDLGDTTTRLDRYETELNEARPGDPRDTTTPNAITATLNALLFGKALSSEAQKQLTQWMKDNQVADSLLRSVLPAGWQIADRSGAGGYGSRGITAVVWAENHAPFIVSIYITQTNASFEQRNEAIVNIGEGIFDQYRLSSDGDSMAVNR